MATRLGLPRRLSLFEKEVGCVSRTRSAAANRRHQHLVAPAGAAIDLVAGAELQILAHADAHFAQTRPVAGDGNRSVGKAWIDLDEGVFDSRRRNPLRI